MILNNSILEASEIDSLFTALKNAKEENQFYILSIINTLLEFINENSLVMNLESKIIIK